MMTSPSEFSALHSVLAATLRQSFVPESRSLARPAPSPVAEAPEARAVFQGLMLHGPTERQLAEAGRFLAQQLSFAAQLEDDLPEDPTALDDSLADWLWRHQRRVSERFEEYRARRAQGAPRHLLTTRSQAFHVLRGLAPAKVVDGAWLAAAVREGSPHRALRHIHDDEQGAGCESRSHALLYRRLLESHGLARWQGRPNAFYIQGAIQLALGCHGHAHMPEVIGFTLANELPRLSTFIVAHELAELGIDARYFELHLASDGGEGGHALQAMEAVLEGAPLFGFEGYWARVRRGFRLSQLGLDAQAIARSFDLESEMLGLLQSRSELGEGSEDTHVAGRSLAEWLVDPIEAPDLLAALAREGWLMPGEPEASNTLSGCRLWQHLLARRDAFGQRELQTVCDWLRRDAARDGRAFEHFVPGDGRAA